MVLAFFFLAADTTWSKARQEVQPVSISKRGCDLTSNLNVDTCPVIQTKTVGSLVSSQCLPIEAEFEKILVQSSALGKYGKDNAKGALVSKREVGFFTSVLVSEENGNGFISTGGSSARRLL